MKPGGPGHRVIHPWLVVATIAAAFPSAARTQDAPCADHPGQHRWTVKTSVPRGGFSARATGVTLSDLFSLDPPGVIRRNEFLTERIPAPSPPNALGLKEGDIVATVGWLRVVALEASGEEGDGDYHVQISPNRTGTQRDQLIVEVPCPHPDFVASAGIRQRASRIRAWLREQTLEGREASSRGSVMRQPPCVRVVGQLYYDSWHAGDPNRGKKGMKAATDWEIHPVLRMEFAPRTQCSP